MMEASELFRSNLFNRVQMDSNEDVEPWTKQMEGT